MLKKRQLRSLTLLSVVLVLAILLASCSASSRLVGKWEGIDELSGADIFIQFNSDGTAQSGSSALGVTSEGTYEVIDSDTLALSNSEGVSQSLDFTLEGDTLTLTADGQDLILHKVP